MCHKYEEFLFSHAGISNTFCKNNEIDVINIEDSINDLYKFKPYKFRFNLGRNLDYTGDDVCQTPIWIRPNSLLKDGLEEVIHVVGHTHVNNIEIKGNCIFTDCGNNGEYLVLEDGIINFENFLKNENN